MTFIAKNKRGPLVCPLCFKFLSRPAVVKNQWAVLWYSPIEMRWVKIMLGSAARWLSIKPQQWWQFKEICSSGDFYYSTLGCRPSRTLQVAVFFVRLAIYEFELGACYAQSSTYIHVLVQWLTHNEIKNTVNDIMSKSGKCLIEFISNNQRKSSGLSIF